MTKKKTHTDKTVLLIDGDIFAYRACVNSEQETYISDIVDDPRANAVKDGLVNNFITRADASDLKVLWSSVDDCIDHIERVLTYYRDEKFPETTDVIVAVTGKQNFRKDVLDTYKGNRSNNRKPIALPEVKQHLIDNWDAILEEGIEADDILAIKATDPNIKGKKIIVSVDKDFRQIPNTFVFNPDKDFHPEWIKRPDADYMFLEQTLAGDQVDNYKGCPSIGPAGAAKVLDRDTSLEDNWEAVIKTFKKKGLTEDDALVQARCARLLRHGEYDWKTKEVKLWKS